MSYAVRLRRDAATYVGRLSANQKQRVLARLRQLSADPTNARTSKPLRGGEGFRSSRVGSLRIVYTVNAAELAVEVVRVGPRGQVYRNL